MPSKFVSKLHATYNNASHCRLRDEISCPSLEVEGCGRHTLVLCTASSEYAMVDKV